jgi:hypothetical protein
MCILVSFLPWHNPQRAKTSSLPKIHDHTDTTQSVGLLWTSNQPDAETSNLANTQNSQQTNIHAPGGIRTPNSSKRAAVNPHLIPRGHWDLHCFIIIIKQTVLYNVATSFCAHLTIILSSFYCCFCHSSFLLLIPFLPSVL